MPSGEHAARARVTYDLWRKPPHLASDDAFDALLSCYGLTAEQFMGLIACPAQELMRRSEREPEWMTFVAMALDEYGNDDATFSDADDEAIIASVLPPMRAGMRLLEDALLPLARSPGGAALPREVVAAEYRHWIGPQLEEIVLRPLVVELAHRAQDAHIASGE